MSYIYSYPVNLPTSSIRFHRFPYEGVRESAKLNLLLHSVLGDIRVIHKALEDAETVVDSIGIYDFYNHPAELGPPGVYGSNKYVSIKPIALNTNIKDAVVRYNIATTAPKLTTTFSFRTATPQLGVSVPTKELETALTHMLVTAASVISPVDTIEPSITFPRPEITTT